MLLLFQGVVCSAIIFDQPIDQLSFALLIQKILVLFNLEGDQMGSVNKPHYSISLKSKMSNIKQNGTIIGTY